MDEVFGDESRNSVADQERLLAIHKRIGLSAYGHKDEAAMSKGSEEKIAGSDHLA
jgi:hypothetical protein